MLGKFKNLLKLSSVYSIGSLSERVQSFALLPVYTFYLQTEDFGILALLVLYVDLFSKFIIAPVTNGFTRYYYKPDWQCKADVLSFNIFIFLLTKSLFVFAVAWPLQSLLATSLFNSIDMLFLIQLSSLSIILRPVCSFLTTYVRLLEMAKYYVFVNLISLFISSLLILYLLIFLDMGIVSMVFGEILRALMLSVACFPVWFKKAKFSLSFSILKEPLAFGYPQILSGYSNLLIQSGDRYLLQLFMSASSVGLYSFGYKIASIINFLIVGPLKQALAPFVLKEEKNPLQQKEFLKKSANHYYLFALSLWLFLSIFSAEIVRMVASNDSFWGSWVIIPIIGFSYVQHGLGNFVGWGVSMANKGHIISANIFFAALINMVLNFFFIPVWGILGAAAATLISYIVWNGLKMYFSAKFYNLHFDLRSLAISTLIAVLVLYFGISFAGSELWYINILIKTVILFSFPCVIWFGGLIDSEEKHIVRNFFSTNMPALVKHFF